MDFDPETVRRLRSQGLTVRFGDGQDPDFLESLPLLDGALWVVSTLPDLASNRTLLHALAERGYGGKVAVVARDEAQGAALKRAGVSTVFYPFRDAVNFIVEHLIALLGHTGHGRTRLPPRRTLRANIARPRTRISRPIRMRYGET
ncbi:MAG: NAD-binding protein [Halothiobacillaceae bacterium]